MRLVDWANICAVRHKPSERTSRLAMEVTYMVFRHSEATDDAEPMGAASLMRDLENGFIGKLAFLSDSKYAMTEILTGISVDIVD